MNANTKVLIVDDEEVVRRAHLRTLAAAQCQAHAVWNGEEALHAMENDRFDVVLLDLRMPGIDGMAVLRTLKDKWPDSEVIVITGYPCVETAKEAIRLGAYDYLAKPVPPDEIIKAASDAMRQKRWALRRERAAAGPANSVRGEAVSAAQH